ncbi:putative E3 ubiquitin-protein ligase RNF170 [Hypsibius exemplaris]|uniref:E3 ubiquitin-protein ligase RNF170 n=1 Tax=Hypsibius exemplaris TaxID=2072580 RepID=A0A1W0WE17_HYPEX|nr:putative E3 ubiquitin-protein ligase RNF170 [Hypsibius exemplaris]
MFEWMTDFLGMTTPPPPPQRGFIESLISWLGRGFIVLVVLIVLAVIAWSLFKHYVLSSIARTIRPEYRDLINVVRQLLTSQHIRDQPPVTTSNGNGSGNNFRSTETGCPVCLLDPAELPVQTNCGHLFCGNCIIAYWKQGTWGTSGVKCPVCRQRVTLLMRDMRPGSAIPEDLDRVAAVETEIRAYNRRFSGEPRSLWEKIRDLPGILTHFGRNVTITDGLGLLFHGRMAFYAIAFVVYFLMPFDLLPEAFMGVFGLMDDLAAFGILAAQVAGVWRAVVANRAAPINAPPQPNRREGFRAF